MKVKSILVSMFALAALASCSNDENLPSGNPDINVEGREAYMSVSVTMPKSTGTRAPSEAPGSGAEQKVDSVLLA